MPPKLQRRRKSVVIQKAENQGFPRAAEAFFDNRSFSEGCSGGASPEHFLFLFQILIKLSIINNNSDGHTGNNAKTGTVG